MVDVDFSKIYGTSLTDPILGHYYAIPKRFTKPKEIKFDTSFLYVSYLIIFRRTSLYSLSNF